MHFYQWHGDSLIVSDTIIYKTMDEQWNARGMPVPPDSRNRLKLTVAVIWLGHLWMQTFLARWLVRTDTPTENIQVCVFGKLCSCSTVD